MDTFLLVIVNALAVHRLTKLAIDDTILSSVRERIFNKWPPSPTSWSYVLTCPWCISFWFALIAVIGMYTIPSIWYFIALVLALSSVVGLIEDRR